MNSKILEEISLEEYGLSFDDLEPREKARINFIKKREMDNEWD